MILTMVLAAATPSHGVGATVNKRGAGIMSCATAFLSENRVGTENWIAGYWTAWDMARIVTDDPIAGSSDLAGIVGEVEVVCKTKPSSSLLLATMEARNNVKGRESRDR